MLCEFVGGGGYSLRCTTSLCFVHRGHEYTAKFSISFTCSPRAFDVHVHVNTAKSVQDQRSHDIGPHDGELVGEVCA